MEKGKKEKKKMEAIKTELYIPRKWYAAHARATHCTTRLLRGLGGIQEFLSWVEGRRWTDGRPGIGRRARHAEEKGTRVRRGGRSGPPRFISGSPFGPPAPSRSRLAKVARNPRTDALPVAF